MLLGYCSTLEVEIIVKPLFINLEFTIGILSITTYSRLGSYMLVCYCSTLEVELIDKPVFINIEFTMAI